MYKSVEAHSMQEAGWLAGIKMPNHFPIYVSSMEGELLLTDNELFMLWFSKIMLDTHPDFC